MSIPQSFYDEWQPKFGDSVLIVKNYSHDSHRDEPFRKITEVERGIGTVVVDGGAYSKQDTLPINVDIPWVAGEDNTNPVPLDHKVMVSFIDGITDTDLSQYYDWRDINSKGKIISFRILPPEQEKEMPDTQEDEAYALLDRIKELEKSLADFEYLQNENKKLKAELAKHKPDPFDDPFNDGDTVYYVERFGSVVKAVWSSLDSLLLDLQKQGRVFDTREKTEEFARVEQTRFKLEVLASSNDEETLGFMCEVKHALEGHNAPYQKPYIEAINLIGEEAIREFLEWKR